jgi:rhodanese-related sulfurtransferase
MRYRQSISEAVIIVLAASVLGTAYTALTRKGLFADTQSSPSGSEYLPVMISYEEALALFQAGDALFVDARHEFDYNLGHIKGAINLPLKEFELKKDRLIDRSKDALLVTYCDGAECNSSIELAAKLRETGFTNVRIFFGGWSEWEAHRLPTEGSSQGMQREKGGE